MRIYTSRPAIDRIMDRLIPVPVTGCWLYDGKWQTNGYGVCGVNGKSTLVHRISYEHFHGSIPEGMLVCHTCDVPPCFNPDHLFLGNKFSNFLDAKLKGRVRLGSKKKLAKLTEEIVLYIRESSENSIQLAERFSVSPSIITSVRRNKTWKHVI